MYRSRSEPRANDRNTRHVRRLASATATALESAASTLHQLRRRACPEQEPHPS